MTLPVPGASLYCILINHNGIRELLQLFHLIFNVAAQARTLPHFKIGCCEVCVLSSLRRSDDPSCLLRAPSTLLAISPSSRCASRNSHRFAALLSSSLRVRSLSSSCLRFASRSTSERRRISFVCFRPGVTGSPHRHVMHLIARKPLTCARGSDDPLFRVSWRA